MEPNSTAASRPLFRNRILARLPSADDDLLSQLQDLDLPWRTVLRKPGVEDGYVYFLEEGMASATALSSEGASIEVGLIGREGFVGIDSVLDHPATHHQIMMQASGSGFSLPMAAFRKEFLKGGPLMGAVHDFMYPQLAQAAPTALCNRLHATEPRMARWLLGTADMVRSDTLHLTQGFLGQ